MAQRVYRPDRRCLHCGSPGCPNPAFLGASKPSAAERHPVGKGPETNRNAATYGVLRRKLNRLARRPPGYRKSLAMLVDSLALVWLERGWIHHAGPC